MEICLHVGAHRTGTTGLQVALEQQQQKLARAQIAFWGPNRTRKGFVAGLVKNPKHLAPDDEATGKRSHGRIAMEVARLRRLGVKRIILSEENMIGTMVENLESGCLYGQAQQRLRRFAPGFDGCDAQIWLALRSYDMHWASQLAFRINAGGLVPAQHQIDMLAAQLRRWPDLIVSLKQAMPKARIMVWRFEDWVGRSSNLLDRLVQASLGIHVADTARSNRSLSAADLSKLVSARGDKTGAAYLADHNIDGRFMPFNAAQRAQMQKNYRDDLSWLKAGAEGCATYLDPSEGTFGGRDMTKGSPHERQETSVASPR